MSRRQSKPTDQVIGNCHWEQDDTAYYLVDEANVIWQTFYKNSPMDSWEGSIQRHETMGDNF